MEFSSFTPKSGGGRRAGTKGFRVSIAQLDKLSGLKTNYTFYT